MYCATNTHTQTAVQEIYEYGVVYCHLLMITNYCSILEQLE